MLPDIETVKWNTINFREQLVSRYLSSLGQEIERASKLGKSSVSFNARVIEGPEGNLEFLLETIKREGYIVSKVQDRSVDSVGVNTVIHVSWQHLVAESHKRELVHEL